MLIIVCLNSCSRNKEFDTDIFYNTGMSVNQSKLIEAPGKLYPNTTSQPINDWDRYKYNINNFEPIEFREWLLKADSLVGYKREHDRLPGTFYYFFVVHHGKKHQRYFACIGK